MRDDRPDTVSGIPLRLLNSIAAARRGAKRNDGRGADKSV